MTTENSRADALTPCIHADNPKACYRVRCQLGGKCVDDDMSPRHPAPSPADERSISDGMQNFACYLIDNCEVETITEESIQAWLGHALANPRYARAASANETGAEGAKPFEITEQAAAEWASRHDVDHVLKHFSTQRNAIEDARTLHLLAAAPQPAQADAQIDVEAMLRACVPGGDICDPQRVADSIREWFDENSQKSAQVDAREGLTDDLRQRCRELLELTEKCESPQVALRALANTYRPDISWHDRRSMAVSQTHIEAMRALLQGANHDR